MTATVSEEWSSVGSLWATVVQKVLTYSYSLSRVVIEIVYVASKVLFYHNVDLLCLLICLRCYTFDNLHSIPGRSWTQFHNSHMNCSAWLKTPVRDNYWRLQKCLINSLATSCISLYSLQEIKCLILVSLSATTNIVLHLFNQGSPFTKSINILSHIWSSVCRSLRLPNKARSTPQIFLQVWQFLTNLSTSTFILCRYTASDLSTTFLTRLDTLPHGFRAKSRLVLDRAQGFVSF